jgi:hypothetical protein
MHGFPMATLSQLPTKLFPEKSTNRRRDNPGGGLVF